MKGKYSVVGVISMSARERPLKASVTKTIYQNSSEKQLL